VRQAGVDALAGVQQRRTATSTRYGHLRQSSVGMLGAIF
jgi:hypothetical protein